MPQYLNRSNPSQSGAHNTQLSNSTAVGRHPALGHSDTPLTLTGLSPPLLLPLLQSQFHSLSQLSE